MGRNSAFDHAGNVAIAAAAGAVGYLVSQRAVFLLVPVFALLAIGATLSIPHDAIDQNRARGLDGDGQTPGQGASGYRMLLRSRPLVLFAVCAMLFHFANAPLASAGRTEARAVAPGLGDRDDVGLHHRGAAHYASGGSGCRRDGG